MVLDQNFGMIRTTQEGDSLRLVGIDLMPTASDALFQFKKSGHHITLLIRKSLSLESLESLKQFLPMIDEFIVFEEDDFIPALSSLYERISLKPEEAIFVSINRVLRSMAAEIGCLAVPDPKMAAMVLNGQSLNFVKVLGEKNKIEHIPRNTIVTYHLESINDNQWMMLAVMSHAAILKAIALRLHLEILPFEISTEDALLIQLDNIDQENAEKLLQQRKVLFSDAVKILLAIGPSDSSYSLTFHGRHGHFLALFPDPTLLEPDVSPIIAAAASIPLYDRRISHETQLIISKWPIEKVKILPVSRENISVNNVLLDIEKSESDYFNPAILKNDIERYSGALDLDSSGKIESRHSLHPNNFRVIQGLSNDLRSIGYNVRICPFEAGESGQFPEVKGKTFLNVIAELPGIGDNSVVDPEISEQIRQIFLKYALPYPEEAWIREVKQLVGETWFKENKLDTLSPLELRIKLESIFNLNPWSEWWTSNSQAPPGLGAKIVIVGCHLDSTAGRNDPLNYDPTKHPAPGADDDASGIAGVLAIARYLSQFRGKLKHTVQFCFFNAEEAGRHGSHVYAYNMKSLHTPIKAVICIDMIGYNKEPLNRIFEIHAGYTDRVIRDSCLPLATLIEKWAYTLPHKLGPAQIYKGLIQEPTGVVDDPWNRDKYDGAIERSDHFSFQKHHYPAVLVSEDFFINQPSPIEPEKDRNINYHEIGDRSTEIDVVYGSDIISAVAFAVKELAEI